MPDISVVKVIWLNLCDALSSENVKLDQDYLWLWSNTEQVEAEDVGV